jgi:hypothetical protein
MNTRFEQRVSIIFLKKDDEGMRHSTVLCVVPATCHLHLLLLLRSHMHIPSFCFF